MPNSAAKLIQKAPLLLQAITLLFGACFSLVALAQSDLSPTAEPKIELGLGIAVQSLREYRGSSEHQTNALPFPYIVYRGDFLELDRDSAKGKLFSSDQIELALSADASYTEDNDNNPLRAGMDSLDPTFELGPSLEVNITGPNLDQGWLARFPVRGVFAVDTSNINIEHVGFLASPKLTYKYPELWVKTNFKFDLGIVYGDQQYHDYIYGVSALEATITRPEYQAQSGYSGFFVKPGIEGRYGDWWLKAYLRYDNLAGSKNETSPLYQTDHYLSAGFAIARVLWKSK